MAGFESNGAEEGEGAAGGLLDLTAADLERADIALDEFSSGARQVIVESPWGSTYPGSGRASKRHELVVDRVRPSPVPPIRNLAEGPILAAGPRRD